MSERTYTVEEVLAGRGPGDPLAEGGSALQGAAASTDTNVIGDVARGVGSGVINMAQGVVGLGAYTGADYTEDAGNPLSWAYHKLGGISENLSRGQSESMKQARGAVEGAWDDNRGFVENFADTVGTAVQNPYSLVGYGSEALGSVGFIGKGAGMLGKLAPKLSAPVRAGVVEGGAVTGLVGGEIASTEGTTYADRLYGIPAGAASMGVTYLGGRIGGRLDPDTFVTQMFTKAPAGTTASAKGAAVNKGLRATSSRIANATIGAGIEATEEGIQEGLETGFTNLGTDDPFFDGVGQAFTIGAISGGVLGGGLGAVQRSRKLSDETAPPPPTETEGDTKPANKVRDDFQAVAQFIAEQKNAATATENADPEQAAWAVGQAMKGMDGVTGTRQDLKKLLNAMGGDSKPERRKAFAHIAAMTQMEDKKLASAASRIMQIATGLPPKQLPRFDSPRSLSFVDNAVKPLTDKLNTLNRSIKAVGNGDQSRRAKLEAQKNDVEFQLEALGSTKYIIENGIRAGVKSRKALQREMNEQGQIIPEPKAQGQLDLRVDGEQVVGGEQAVNPLEAAAPELNAGPVVPAATEAAPQQDSMFGDVPPDTGALDFKPQQLRNNPENRLAFTNAFLNKSLQEIGDPVKKVGWKRLMNLTQLGSGSTLKTLSELTGIELPKLRAATKGELQNPLTGQSVSSLELIQERVTQAISQQTRPYLEQGRAILELALTPEGKQMKYKQLLKATKDTSDKSFNGMPEGLKVLVDRARKDTAEQSADALMELFGGPLLSQSAGMPTAPTMAVRQLGLEAAEAARPQQAELGLEQEQAPAAPAAPAGRVKPPPKTQGSDSQTSDSDPAPRARLSNEPTVPQMEGGLLQRVISRIIKGWRNVPEIVIIENMASKLVPQAVRDALTTPDGGVRFQLTFHGSGQLFNRFSLDFIGTGEGFNAYGYGMYFASRRRVAEYYRNLLTKEGDSGAIYDVQIPEDFELLAWHEPFSNQSEQVQQALAPIMDEVYEATGESDPSGNVIYDVLAELRGFGTRTPGRRNFPAASHALQELGIPGLRYLDGTSKLGVLREPRQQLVAILGPDATPEQVMGALDQFSPDVQEVLVAMDADGWLGMTPYQAVGAAVLRQPMAKGGSEALSNAVLTSLVGDTNNYVIWQEDTISIEAINEQAVRFQLEEAQKKPAAFFHNGKVYINKEMMGSEEDVARALYHEVVGHFGLRGVLGNKLNPELDRIWKARKTDIMAYANKYSLDVSKVEERREATEEFIAAQAESLYEQGLLTKIINMIKAWWQDLNGESLTDEQIMRDYIKPAQNFVQMRDMRGMKPDGSIDVRFKAELDNRPSPGQNLMAPKLEESGLQKAIGAIAERGRELINSAAFTMTLLHRLARRIPATNRLIKSLQDAGAIANDWQQVHNILGEKLHKLSGAQREALTTALVQYSSDEKGVVPFINEHAEIFYMDESGDPSTWTLQKSPVTDENVTVDTTIWNALDEQTQNAMKSVFESTAKVLNERTASRLEMLKQFYTTLLDDDSVDKATLDQMYTNAVNATIGNHNRQSRRVYVPQSRVGKYRVVGKSEYYLEVESRAIDEGDRAAQKELRKLQLDSDHFLDTFVDNESQGKKMAASLREQGFDALAPTRQVLLGRDASLDAGNLMKILTRYENELKDADTTDAKIRNKLGSGIRDEMRRALLEEGSQDTELMSQLRKRNIAGVRGEQVLDNTLEHIKHFGYAIASAKTGPERIEALKAMRTQINRMEGSDQPENAARFEEVVSRLDSQFDIQDGLLDRLSRGGMAASSLYYLLLNPSYYLLQLTQSWIMTAPYLAGEYGPQAWSELATSFSDLKPMISSALKGRQEIKFEGFSTGETEMFVTLQARNVLDVGMNHDMGTLGDSTRLQQGMGKLYFAARNVELLNRSSAALTAYRLRMRKLTKGRPLGSYSKDQQAAFHAKAVNSAEQATYKTHGDYSYMNASKLFKAPVIRNIMQFKKIGFVVAELMVESAKQGWKKPRLSVSLVRVLDDSENSIQVDKDILAKVRDGSEWVTDAEFEQLRNAIIEYRKSGTADKELSNRDADIIEQALQSELSDDVFITKEAAAINRKSFAYIIGTSGAISGTLSVPFLTSLIAYAARMVDGDDEDEDETVEATVMRVMGPELGSLTLRGVTGGIIGIDVSRRIGINFVEQMLGSVIDVKARDPVSAVNEVVVGMLGPSVSLVQDTMRAASYLEQWQTTGSYHDMVKGFAYASPLGIRNLLNGALMDRQGVMTDARDVVLRRDQLTDAEVYGKMVGFSPAKISEFYQLRNHVDKVDKAANEKRLLIKRSYFEATRDGDSARRDRAINQWRELQEDQRAAGVKPSPLSELQQYVRRKRRVEQDSISGIQTTSRNRAMVERIVERYGADFFRDPAQYGDQEL